MSRDGPLGKACQWIRCGSAVCPSRVEVTVRRARERVGEAVAACPPAVAGEHAAASAAARARTPSRNAGGLLVPCRFIHRLHHAGARVARKMDMDPAWKTWVT